MVKRLTQRGIQFFLSSPRPASDTVFFESPAALGIAFCKTPATLDTALF